MFSFAAYDIHLTARDSPKILVGNQRRTFWMSWENHVLSFGLGPLPKNNTLLKWKMEKTFNVQHLGFGGDNAHLTEFRLVSVEAFMFFYLCIDFF